MSSFDKLPAHERKMAERRCHHRVQLAHARKGSKTYLKNLGWARYWRAQIRRQMRALQRDARRKGNGGWKRNARGRRYQILAGAYSGKLCVLPLRASGNQVTGGKAAERVVTAAKLSASYSASGRRHSFYSQSGYWTVKHGITGEPYGYRSDCSSWFTSMYWSAGLPDPNGQNFAGGYTGTLGSHGRAISRELARHTPGAAVLFGPWPHHHVEMALGDGTERTIGHGSAPVDYGSFDLMGGEKHFRKYV